jgi:hypothetical protein
MIKTQELVKLAKECLEHDLAFGDISPEQGSTFCNKLVRQYVEAVNPANILALVAQLKQVTAEREDLRQTNSVIQMRLDITSEDSARMTYMELKLHRKASMRLDDGSFKEVNAWAVSSATASLRETLDIIMAKDKL